MNVRCPGCLKTYKVRTSRYGKRVKYRCGAMFDIPEGAAIDAPPYLEKMRVAPVAIRTPAIPPKREIPPRSTNGNGNIPDIIQRIQCLIEQHGFTLMEVRREELIER